MAVVGPMMSLMPASGAVRPLIAAPKITCVQQVRQATKMLQMALIKVKTLKSRLFAVIGI